MNNQELVEHLYKTADQIRKQATSPEEQAIADNLINQVEETGQLLCGKRAYQELKAELAAGH